MSEAAVRNAGETTIRVLSFDGKDETKFDEWYTKKLAIARKRGYREVLLSDELEIPSDSEIVAGVKVDGTVLSDEQKLNYKMNSLAYSDLVLDLSGTALITLKRLERTRWLRATRGWPSGTYWSVTSPEMRTVWSNGRPSCKLWSCPPK